MQAPTQVPQEEPRSRCPNGGHRHHGRRLLGGLVLVVVALAAGYAGGYASKAHAWGGGHAHFAVPPGPGLGGAHVKRLVGWIAGQVDATPAQRERLDAIAKSAADDLHALRARSGAVRSDGLAALGAPEIDRAAIEKVRVDQMALADSASKRVAEALADVAEVLTPEQRRTLAAQIGRLGERRGWLRS